MRLYRRSGKGLREVSEDLGVSVESLRAWSKRIDIDAGRRQDGLTSEEREELRRLRRENRVLREEREILKNAEVGSTHQRNMSQLITLEVLRGEDGAARDFGRASRVIVLLARRRQLRVYDLRVSAIGVMRLAVGCVAAATVASCSPSASTTSSNSSSAQVPLQRDSDILVGSGSDKLPGTLVLPLGRGPFPAVVLVSGSGPNDRDETIGPNRPFADLARGLAVRGIASLRYDKRTKVYALAIAPRLSSFTATEEYVPDAVAALQLLRSRADIDPHRLFVLGHSQGGTFAPLIAQSVGGLAGVVLWAAASEPFGADLLRQATYLAQVEHQSGPAVDAQLATIRQQAALVDDPNIPLTTPVSSLPGGLGPPYWRSLTHYDAVATARALNMPILLQQGDRDYQVTVADDLSRWDVGLGGRSSVTVKQYPQADHLFLDGSGPPTPTEYFVAGHVDSQVIADLSAWLLTQPAA